MKNGATPARVNYFDEQFLRRQEFEDEQAYQVALRRRHNLGHHDWGIVVGLDLAVEEGVLVVRPGMAIDLYGRELLLAAKRPIATGEFLRLGSNRLDVWLFYENTKGAPAPRGFVACGADESETYYRTNETPRIFLERAGVSRINARRPKLVPPAVLDTPAQLKTTDDPLVVAPIYLGRVQYVTEETDPLKQFLIDGSDRPYIGATAEVVDHPATAARVEIGRIAKYDDKRALGETEVTYAANDKRAFAVFVPSGQTKLDPRFEIDVDNNNYLRGATTLYGNLTMRDGAVQFTEAAATSDEAQRENPSIYRASGDQGDELRIDLGKIFQANRVFVVGFTTEDGSFRASMKLEYAPPEPGKDPQPLLTIYGDLKLKGLIKSAGVIERTLAEETLNALLASFQAGITAAGGR